MNAAMLAMYFAPMISQAVKGVWSKKERDGIVPNPVPNSEILRQKNYQTDVNNYFRSPEVFYNNQANALQKDSLNSIPEGTQLDLFATSGNDAFNDLLNSDAITGMDATDLGNLANQFAATSKPEDLSEAVLKDMPNVLTNANTNNPSNSISNLIKLFRTLQPQPEY